MLEKYLDNKTINYKFSYIEYIKLIENIKKDILNNFAIIKKANDIDIRYYELVINKESLIDILNNYKNIELKEKTKLENVYIIYNGNPKLTLKLCLEAILNGKRLFLDCRDFMLGVNTALVKIINDRLSNYGIYNAINIVNLTPFEELKKNEDSFGKIFCIDSENEGMELIRYKITKFEEIYIESIAIYISEEEEFDVLAEKLFEYSEANNIELQSYSEFGDESAEIIAKYATEAKVVLISNNINTQELYKNTIKDKELIINKNPFNNMGEVLNLKM